MPRQKQLVVSKFLDLTCLISEYYFTKCQSQDYRNRFVETKGLLAERRAGKAIYGGLMHPMMPDPKYFGPDEELDPPTLTLTYIEFYLISELQFFMIFLLCLNNPTLHKSNFM